jgi:hypothetical protein
MLVSSVSLNFKVLDFTVKSTFQVGVRRLTRSEECEDSETKTDQSLQYWREMNCSEQFG